MQAATLAFLRITIGALLIWWGLDKLVNVSHGVEVAKRFYFGVGTGISFLQGFGVVEAVLGLLVVLGWARRWTYPPMIAITGATLIGVWKSVIDPWGWLFQGVHALFYPSVIIFAGALVLWAFRDLDRIAIDAR